MTRVKICGITNLEDALAASEAGADLLGFNFYARSPRHLSPDEARGIVERLPEGVEAVGVFVNEPAEHVRRLIDDAGLRWAQLHGDEPPETCRALDGRAIKALRIRATDDPESALRAIEAYGGAVAGFLLDTHHPALWGGTGETFDWAVAQRAAEVAPVILSGGLNPENVAAAARIARPYGLDVSSGVERERQKDLALIQQFIQEVRRHAVTS
jgi:phosphoribosylanthranilate isomerase